MSELAEIDLGAELVIGASGMDGIRQNIAMIISTFAYSIPLDRGFAHSAAILDSPAPLDSARLAGEIMDAIERYEPRVVVESLDWRHSQSGLMDGRLMPVVKFRLKEGALDA